MSFARMLVCGWIAVASTFAAHMETGSGRVTVFWNDAALDLNLTVPAKRIANEIFAPIGVRLEWRTGEPSRGQPAGYIVIDTTDDTPNDFRPGALAFARVSEGVHITVLYDRVRTTVSRSRVPVLLGHVLAHEIAHILQGVARHSESGLMKARWGDADYYQMAWKSLSFTPTDVELIRAGLNARARAPAEELSHPMALAER